MATATVALLDRLRKAHGNCSDYRVSKLLGVTTSSVSQWRTESSHMSTDHVVKACELAGLERQVWVWVTKVAAEREKGETRRLAVDLLYDLRAAERGEEPRPGSLYELLTKGLARGKWVAIILIGLLWGGFPVPSKACGDSLFTPDIPYTNRPRARRRSWWADLFGAWLTWLPDPSPA